MERKKLSADEISASLEKLSGWSAAGDRLKKKYSFSNFAESLAFINKIGDAAEKADHHPDIKFGWGYAEIEITTHDTGGITHNDFDLAEMIDKL